MPIEKDYDYMQKNKNDIIINEEINVFAVNNYLRNIIVVEASKNEAIERFFEQFYFLYKQSADTDDEPLLNIIASYRENAWRVFLIPREKHRPDFYFAEGENNILLSPASVDIGGVCITPLEKDFKAGMLK